MNPLEQQLHYPFGETLPETGEAIEVAPGIHWLRMALPFQLDHVNLWLLADRIDGRDGWTLVDCGIDDAPTRAAWERVFISPLLVGRPLLRVVVTHMHPDHIGLAHWLTERFGVRLWISAADHAAATLATLGHGGFGGPRFAAYMASHGWRDAAAQAHLMARTDDYTGLVPAVPSVYRRLVDGDRLSIGGLTWHCSVGYGHAPEHIALHCPALDVLISGDMVLPRISTNVSVHENEPEADPLARYLRSIAGLRETLPATTRVLPSHGRPFSGLHTRIEQLAAHHEERFAEVMKACAEASQSAHDLLPVLFRRPLDLHQTSFAMGESIAHLNALWLAGRLAKRVGADGIERFAPG